MTEEMEWITPPDDEQDALARKALNVAFDMLSPMRQQEEMDHAVMVKLILRVIAAVQGVNDDAVNELKKNNPGKKCHSYFYNPSKIVATAIFYLLHDCEPDIDSHPFSVAGCQIMAFAQAVVALSSFGQIVCSIDDPGVFGEQSAKRLSNLAAEDDED